jgi:hypothetical protein
MCIRIPLPSPDCWLKVSDDWSYPQCPEKVPDGFHPGALRSAASPRPPPPARHRIPMLAIHLQRGLYEQGFKPNFQTNMVPLLATTIAESLNQGAEATEAEKEGEAAAAGAGGGRSQCVAACVAVWLRQPLLPWGVHAGPAQLQLAPAGWCQANPLHPQRHTTAQPSAAASQSASQPASQPLCPPPPAAPPPGPRPPQTPPATSPTSTTRCCWPSWRSSWAAPPRTSWTSRSTCATCSPASWAARKRSLCSLAASTTWP